MKYGWAYWFIRELPFSGTHQAQPDPAMQDREDCLFSALSSLASS